MFNIIGNGIKEQLDNNIRRRRIETLAPIEKYSPQAAEQQSIEQQGRKATKMKARCLES